MSAPEIQAAAAGLKRTFDKLLARGRVAEARTAADQMAACGRELLTRFVINAGGNQAMVDEAAVRLGLDQRTAH